MNNFLFDTHAHLDLLKNFEETITQIEERKIYTIAVTNLPPLYERLESKVNSKFIRPALGFHPELIEQYKKFIPQMWDLLPQAKYIGEVGLDFKVGKSSKNIQIDFFEALIENCNRLGGKILTIHSRASSNEVVSIIGNDFNGKYILHWFSGSLITSNEAVSNGAFFSINYAMLNSKSGLKIIQNIPDDRLLLESDMPFVLAENKRPFSILEINKIVERLASIRKVEYNKMLYILNNNFKSLIGVKK